MINAESKVVYKKKTYSLVEFGKKFGVNGDINEIISLAEKLERKGRITIKNYATEEQEMLNKINDQDEVLEVNNAIEVEEQTAKAFKREQALSESDTTSFELLFNTTLEAQKFYNYIINLGINTCEMIIKPQGGIALRVMNVTPEEYVKITRKYSIEKGIQAGVNVTGNTINKAVEGVGYIATNVGAPIVKIAGDATSRLAKGLVHTAVKSGASIINCTAQATRETREACATDRELIKAQSELIEAKDTVKRFFAKKFNKRKGGNGINIL